MATKKISIFITIAILLCFCSCDDSKKGTVSYPDAEATVSTDAFEGANPVSDDGRYIYFKETVDYKQQFPNASVTNIGSTEKGMFSAISSDGKAYFSQENSTAGEMNGRPVVSTDNAVMWEYDIKSGEWREIIRTDLYHNGIIHVASEKYVVWESDENCNWSRNALNVYDKNTGETKEIYRFTVDSESGGSNISWWTDGTVLLLGDSVFFHDITGYYENGDPIYKVFEYSVPDGKLTCLATDARNVTEYAGDVAWVAKAGDDFDSCLYSRAENGYIFKVSADMGYYLKSSGNLATVVNKLNKYRHDAVINGQKYALPEQHEDKYLNMIDGYSMLAFRDGKATPLMVSKATAAIIERPCSDGRFICASLSGSKGEKPLIPRIYDSITDKFISFEELCDESNNTCNWYIGGKYLVVAASLDDEFNYYAIDTDTLK